MRAEYEFTGGTRGKHYRAMQAGYTITIHHADGTKAEECLPIGAWLQTAKSRFQSHDGKLLVSQTTRPMPNQNSEADEAHS